MAQRVIGIYVSELIHLVDLIAEGYAMFCLIRYSIYNLPAHRIGPKLTVYWKRRKLPGSVKSPTWLPVLFSHRIHCIDGCLGANSYSKRAQVPAGRSYLRPSRRQKRSKFWIS